MDDTARAAYASHVASDHKQAQPPSDHRHRDGNLLFFDRSLIWNHLLFSGNPQTNMLR